MTDRMLNELWVVSASAVGLCAVLTAAWNRSLAMSMLIGGAWNLASLWCLARMLRAWLGPHPSRRRVIGWLLVKFPLLYAAIVLLLVQASVSALGFGIGFTVVLLTAMTWFAGTVWRRTATHA